MSHAPLYIYILDVIRTLVLRLLLLLYWGPKYIYQGCTVPVRSGPFLDRTRSTIHVPVRSLILPVPVLPFRSLNAGSAGS